MTGYVIGKKKQLYKITTTKHTENDIDEED